MCLHTSDEVNSFVNSAWYKIYSKKNKMAYFLTRLCMQMLCMQCCMFSLHCCSTRKCNWRVLCRKSILLRCCWPWESMCQRWRAGHGACWQASDIHHFSTCSTTERLQCKDYWYSTLLSWCTLTIRFHCVFVNFQD